MMRPTSHPYWLDIPLLNGSSERPGEGEIVIIGSGIAGVSSAYWLQQHGFRDITLLDFQPQQAASFRNCGHVLYGTVESMQALVALHSEEQAREVWQFSVDICEELKQTIARHDLEVDYRQDGYLVIAVDATEDNEIQQSIQLLQKHGFASEYKTAKELQSLGFREVYGGRFEPGSAQVHPVKLRNALLQEVLKAGAKYHTGIEVTEVQDVQGKVEVQTKHHGRVHYQAAVIAANAYSPLLSRFFASHRLVEPFRGQIMTSRPLTENFAVTYPHSFDHGYEYALLTSDRRLMLGGWRNHTEGGEIGTYDISPNPQVEQGLAEFAKKHYGFKEDLHWEYSWAGIMASSKTGFPFIGPTDSPLIFTVSGFTGHGLSWAHGSAKLLAGIIAGEPRPKLTHLFNPMQR
ncbi:MAG: NAD(P)/FAD-dependent oxidoreductase [Oligoflexus sp.]